MLDEISESVEETGAESTEDSSDEQATSDEIAEDGGEGESKDGEETTPDGAQARPSFDYSYNVKDEKREFPDWVREAIKSKEHEEYLRDLHTKADGLPTIKEKHESLQNQVQSFIALRKDHPNDFIQQMRFQPQEVIGALGKDAILKQFSSEELMEAWDQRRKLDEAPPEVKQALAASEQAESKLNEQERMYQSQQQELMETRAFIIKQAFDRDEVKSFADRYDAAFNQPGAFREYVKQQAMTIENQTGRFAHPDVVIPQVMSQFAPFLNQQPAVTANNQQASAPVEAPKPTIPNVGKSTTGSPVTRSYRTLDELKQLAANR